VYQFSPADLYQFTFAGDTGTATTGTPTTGTLSSSPMKSYFTGLLRVNETGKIVFVKDAVTNALIDSLTAQTNDTAAVRTSAADMAPGTECGVPYQSPDGTKDMEMVTAS
jgi:hypothetical protein